MLSIHAHTDNTRHRLQLLRPVDIYIHSIYIRTGVCLNVQVHACMYALIYALKTWHTHYQHSTISDYFHNSFRTECKYKSQYQH